MVGGVGGDFSETLPDCYIQAHDGTRNCKITQKQTQEDETRQMLKIHLNVVKVYNRSGAGNQPFCDLIVITKDAVNMEKRGTCSILGAIDTMHVSHGYKSDDLK